MTSRFSRGLLLLLLAASAATASAQTIVTYSFTGASSTTPPATFPADAQPTNGTATPFNRGSGTTAAGAADVFNGSGFNSPAFDANDYFGFSVTPNSGFEIDATSLSFFTQRSNTGPLTYAVRSSLDNFATDVSTGTVLVSPGSTVAVPLGAAFRDVQTALTIRIYAFGASAAGGTFRVDNVTLSGAILPLGQAQVIQTVEDGAGYRLLGAPVNGVTVGTLAGINLVQSVVGQYPTFPNDNLFLNYNGTGSPAGYVPAGDVANPVTAGYGFLWYLFDQNITPDPASFGGGTSRSYTVPERQLVASGPVNTSNVTVGFGFHPDGFYLLANPFAQPLAATGITYTGSGGLFSTTLQAYDPTTGFVPVSRTAGTNIATWQGFFAEVQQPTPAFQGGGPSETFTYLAASRNDGPATFISRAAPAELALTLSGTTDAGTTHDAAAIVRVDAAASAGWDAGDASKLTPPTEAYALVAPVGDLYGAPRRQAVLSLPALADVGLAFTTTHAGTFTLTAASLGLSADATVRDLATGAEARLADGLTFTSAATDWTERFVVSFSRTTAGEQAPAGFSLGQVFPNPAAAAARVALRVDAPQTVSATVVDALGRTVATVFEGALGAGQSQDIAVDTSALAPGVYVVRIAGETFSATRRLIVAR